ncbi:MBL fold metallo-hydrolase [Hazenella coriacea]|uniref:Ribonuclease BN (tRNA processing enzyme) n=1 Tax=Hazenella coriacea TaxID=1179467 RepID=A0A4R3L0A4_9BACL|nr:MBL fold metallo-hydrolase [Hazenella coriacea]TCS92612.1 ribonuclease BN (tRNA processing enzyme) [Hazenella coriacea]
MKLTVLGCHSPFPAADGATPGYLLEVDGKRILIDCGSGTLSKLARYIRPYEVDVVLLSHLHHDHISDFFVLQYAIMISHIQKNRQHPLPVWTPDQPSHWYAPLSYGSYIEKHIIRQGQVVSLSDRVTVTFYRTQHSIPCYAMKIQDGKHTLLYGADAGPQTDWESMGKDPDLLICEASYLHRDLPPEEKGHCSAQMAGQVAEKIGAKRLLLTHLYPDYAPEDLRSEASGQFSRETMVAHSGLTIHL